MQEYFLLALGSIVVLGIAAQWIGWRFHIPAIWLLLVFGIEAGPILGLLEPDVLFGDVLAPMVSLSVAIILFEGGLSLQLSELKTIGRVVGRLVFIGSLITWLGASLGAFYVLGLSLPVSLLLGAVIVVTGPTVIIPLLRQVRLTGSVGKVLKWEGIVIDPIGVTLAVLVFEGTLVVGAGAVTLVALTGIAKTVVVGASLGFLAAWLLIFLLRHYLVPDFLHSPVSLMIVIGAFLWSNVMQTESGLLTATIMGIILANQKVVSIKRIVEFKENLRVLLISSLFIVLSARIDASQLRDFGVESFLYLALLILVLRPLAVFICTYGTEFNWREKLFLACVAPRGIVAASMASLFALELTVLKLPDADQLVPETFFVIFGTVTIYGLGAPIIARVLGLYQRHPQGALIIGAHSWARDIGKVLQDSGFKVMLIDTNRFNVLAAQEQDLPAQYGSIFMDHGLDSLVLDGFGKLFALTPNDEVNTLAALHFADVFGETDVYQLRPAGQGSIQRLDGLNKLRSRILFSRNASFEAISDRIARCAEIRSFELTKEVDFAALQEAYGSSLLPLFLIVKPGEFSVFTVRKVLTPAVGEILVALVGGEPPEDIGL